MLWKSHFANPLTEFYFPSTIFVLNFKSAKFAKFGTNKNLYTYTTNVVYVESTVTVTGQCFAISVLSFLHPLHIKHFPIRYIYNDCFSVNFKWIFLWRTLFHRT